MATGQQLAALIDLDDDWLNALTQAEHRRRWGHVEELLAIIAELIHAQLAAFMRANSKPGTQPLKPLRIPRPGAGPRAGSSTGEILSFFGRR